MMLAVCTRCEPGITSGLFEKRFSKRMPVAEAWAASVVARANVVRIELRLRSTLIPPVRWSELEMRINGTNYVLTQN